MAEYNSTQPSFSAGIISTELFSRIDFTKLASGTKQCENWEIRPAGGVAYRTGTKFVAEVKDSTKEVNIIEFSESREKGYALEFGHKYIRFYKNGQRIESGGNPVEVTTTYTSSEIADLKYAQYKNQMYIVHPNHAPAILTRNSDTNWTLTDIVFNPSLPTITSVSIAKKSAKDNDKIVNFDGWQYAVSVEDADGNEGMATKSNVITSDIDLLNQNIEVTFNAPNDVIEGYNFIVYRIFRGEFYYIYKIPFVTGTNSYSLKDVSFQADTTRAIKEPFTAFDGSNYPSAVGFWNQRLVFANTPNKPNAIYGSCVGVFDDFTTTVVNNADESFELELNSGTTDKITDIIPMDDLIVMTQSKIWRIVGTSPSNMQAYIESYSGASGIRPYVYKKSILFVDSSYNTVSNFIYSYELNGYVGQNLDTLCRDLLDGHIIKSVSFRDTPYGVLYVVRNDGVLLGLTYLKEENIYAWHKHTTDGLFLNVCSVDKSIYDDVYVVVQRGDKKYIEMFMDQINIEQGVDDSWHLDCASRYISNVYEWVKQSSPTVQTFYAFKANPKTVTTNLYCWRAYNPKGYYYFYNYSSTNFDTNNFLATSDYSPTNDYTKLRKMQYPKKIIVGPAHRYSYFDFSYTETHNAVHDLIYVTEMNVGAKVYNKSGDLFTQIGIVDTYTAGQIGFESFTYNRDSGSDYDGSAQEINYVYTNGLPTIGNIAYIDKQLTEQAGTITDISNDKITVNSNEYSINEAGIGTTDTITGLSRFDGKAVTVLADGNEYPNIDVINGEVKLDRLCSNILVGLPYTGILEPIPVDVKFRDGGTTVGLNRRISKATIRYFRTRGLWYGTSLDKLYQIKPYVYKDIGYDIPLETNVLNVEVADTYKTESSIIVVQKSPFPALVQSITMGMVYGEKN